MKKIAILLTMVLLSATFLSAKDGDYVKTKNGTYFFKQLKHGLKCCLVGKSSTGEKMKFNKCDITAFRMDGELYEKMPVYKNNLATGEEDFMQVISFRNGLKLYKYEYISKTTDALARRYYVFNEDKLVVEMDDANKPSLTAFFSPK